MGNIPATEFKAKCLELMNRVAERHETYVITKRGKPVARLVPLDHKPENDIFGWLRARGSIEGDIVSPVFPPRAWETLKKWDEWGGPPGPKSTSRSKKSRKRPGSRR
jgi:prevent-host-death family protein